MKKKLWIILICTFVILVTFFISTYFIIKNSLVLKGDDITINFSEEYNDPGYIYKILGKDLTKKVKVKTDLNTEVVGNYKITYTVKYLFFKIERVRKVNVVDKVKPELKLKGSLEKNICPGKQYEEEGYEAIDNYDGDLKDKVQKEELEGKIIYKVTDSSNNTTILERKINYVDNEKPNLTLKGSSVVTINLGNTYNDPGYNVTDNCDTNVNVTKTGTVNTNTVGTYYITYTAKDSKGNTNSVTRTIKVAKFSVGYIYLTFDDGPGSATENILNTLKNKGVKATFFVTGSGSDALIKREFNEGHAIALHTYTHKYDIVYKSVDNYFADLDKVSNRVFNLTGTRPKIIRFPGGSNNTVSNRYNKNIMDTLTREVINRGYTYFDWNITSGDAGGCSNSKCVYNNVVNNLSRTRNNIVLMHDIKWITANALADIIDYAKNNNYQFRVITESTPAVRFK